MEQWFELDFSSTPSKIFFNMFNLLLSSICASVFPCFYFSQPLKLKAWETYLSWFILANPYGFLNKPFLINCRGLTENGTFSKHS